MSSWKSSGISFLQYLNIAARTTREVLKPNLRLNALKRNEQSLRMAKFNEGKLSEWKPVKKDDPISTTSPSSST